MGMSEEKRKKKEAMKLQKLKAEFEVRKRIIRADLQRELTFQTAKKNELEQAWLKIMLKVKETEFKNDIQIVWHTFERALDRKNHCISYTIKLLDIADDQFSRTIANFCVIIDTMINKFLEDLDILSKVNDRRTKELLKAGEDEVDTITKDHNIAETHLHLLLYHSHHTADTRAWNTRGENLVKNDDDNVKFEDERMNLRSYLENNYTCVWDEYKAVLKNYIEETAANQKKVRTLRVKENIMSDIISQQKRSLDNMSGVLKRLRAEYMSYESGEKQAIFRNRRNRHRAACHALKKRMVKGCSLDANRVSLLVKSTDDAMDWLQYANNKGEKILRMAMLCRKFEGQREKVLPFGYTRPHTPTDETHGSPKSKADPLVVNAIATTSGLTNLWQRIAKVELTKRALYREKMLLEQENAYLTRKIQEFSDNESGSDSQIYSSAGSGKKGTINPSSFSSLGSLGILQVSKYKKL